MQVDSEREGTKEKGSDVGPTRACYRAVEFSHRTYIPAGTSFYGCCNQPWSRVLKGARG